MKTDVAPTVYVLTREATVWLEETHYCPRFNETFAIKGVFASYAGAIEFLKAQFPDQMIADDEASLFDRDAFWAGIVFNDAGGTGLWRLSKFQVDGWPR